ncbi:sestrin-1 isoform X1 [Vespa velutina]|uniref:sestrin-1 isoform X1 n=1 Tax=Vespa velutina TaxID=202808 RepID=UPI001FB48048|nr:sestrin-1 isoform X1 [Vespa velutina]XP_047357758.1 sestrin-1 isoform X1 [Vespa velutina]XP_047357759.1 sestrin-1 isoform X1 [Vespa velutina]XP_047357760.1 sestrin-1 isoform X1 [Vespa velutina]XP_047357762.1 sestrin-1 isoform X1 [Vespa velutina]
MYSDPNICGIGASTKGDEVELVSRFLAPLCARDEAARNIALAAARSTVEGWLGGVGSPNQWEETTGAMKDNVASGKFKGQDGRYDMSIERSPSKSTPKNVEEQAASPDTFRSDCFFPQSVTENPVFPEDGGSESTERYPSGSFDCVDGRLGSNESSSFGTPVERRRYMGGDSTDGNRSGRSTSSDEGKGLRIEQLAGKCRRFKDGSESRFGSSCDSERKYLISSSNERLNELSQEDRIPRTKNYIKVKGAKQRQPEEDELDLDTRIYGKSPKFDENLGNAFFDRRNVNFRSKSSDLLERRYRDETDITGRSRERVVFNTLDGFDNENANEIYRENEILIEDANLENSEDDLEDGRASWRRYEQDQDCLRKNDERKFSAGQIKRPLSQDEDISSKSGRVLDSPEVTPGDVGRMLNLGNALDGPRQTQANKYLSLVTLHLPVILRLSVNCPFQNVRIKCAEILEMVKDRGLPVPEPAFDGPSAFVPTSELPDLNNLDEKTRILLMDAFLQNNRLDHVSRVMSSHPLYLDHFLRTQNFILRGDGPLPYDYRHLIAIMAAGRHQCSYLINLQKGEFLLQGGDPLWLQGLRSIPRKLQDLYEINKILAHRPWLLNKTHIEKLTKGADNWSLAEVVHAIVLLAHFHSLSSFVFSCGINEELDNVTGHHYKENIQDNSNKVPPAKEKLSSNPKEIPNGDGKTENVPSPPSSPSIVGEQEVGVETLMERMKRLSEKSESYQITQEELSKRFETVETQSAELAAAPQRSSSILDSDIGLFIDDPTFIYQDFAKRGQLNDIPTFRVQDYSWDDHGYSLVNRLYNDVGNFLDDKFKTTYNLTYYTMGTHSKVDTSRFRRAIWNYIQCMFGIRHDDYDYNEVNQLLERSLKTFIKSAVCYPERVTKKDYDRVMREFKHSEKVHVNLMILEARMQAELLYALRAVMRYMT